MNNGMRVYEPIYGIEGVGSSATATVKVPSNRRHLMTKVFCSATISGSASTDPTAILDEITTMVGTRVVRHEKVADIVALAGLNKLPAGATKALSLLYADPSRADVMDEVITAWDTFGLPEGALVYKFRFKSGLTNPSLSLINVFDRNQMTDKDNNVIRTIVKRSYTNANLGTVGDITNLPTDLPISAIYLKGSANILHVKVTVDDNNVIHDMDTAQNAQFLQDYNLDDTKFSYPLLFSVEGQIARRLEGIRSLALRITSDAPNAVEVWIEQVAPNYV